MVHFLFVDESGHDRKASPYEVLAGIAIRDSELWKLTTELHEAEIKHFGRRYSLGNSELKGTKILKKKVFQHACLNVTVQPGEIAALAKAALDDGANASIYQLKALALAKIGYVDEIFDICRRYNCKAFASIVETDSEPTALDGLRKDYAYLFERFFYFLEDQKSLDQGVIVFDELEKSKSHILVDQTQKYFRNVAVGRARSRLIIPEPFFVHSDLTTGVQIADLLAYIISWGFRMSRMTKPARPELANLANKIAQLRYRAVRPCNGNAEFEIWSFARISDLRTRIERGYVE